MHMTLFTTLYIYNNLIIMVIDYYSSLTYEHLVLDSELSTCFENNLNHLFSKFKHTWYTV